MKAKLVSDSYELMIFKNERRPSFPFASSLLLGKSTAVKKHNQGNVLRLDSILPLLTLLNLDLSYV